MGGRRPHLDLAPEYCDQCGRCLEACSRGALNVGTSHIYVEWSSCEGCIECAQVCEQGAITAKGAPAVARSVPVQLTAPPKVEGAVMTFSKKGAVESSVISQGEGWSVLHVAAVLATAVVMLALKDLVLSLGSVRSMSIGGLVAMRAGLQVLYYGSLIGVLVLLAGRRGLSFPKAFGLTRPSLVASAAWVLAALLAVRLLATMYGAIAQAIGFDPPSAGVTGLTGWFGSDMLGLALATVTVVLVGPFVEEVVFRGMLLPAIAQMAGSKVAIAATAVLFAASHLSLWAFVPLTLLGLALGWMRVSRGSTWPPVVLHALYNGVAVAAAFYVAGVPGGG